MAFSPPPPPLTPLLDMMHHDALRAALLRTRASDHLSLRLTCRRVREIIDSDVFRLERCQGGFAEITAVLSQQHLRYNQDDDEEEEMDEDHGYNQYDEVGYVDDEFGFRRNHATLVVDGRNAGKASFTILPRRDVGDNFHYMGDGLSGDLVSVAATFFDRQGRPKLSWLKEAFGTNDSLEGMLYLEKLQWNDAACRNTNWVGAMALRALLMETALKNEWSIAIYIPEAEVQFGEEEKAAEAQYRADRNRPMAGMAGQVITIDMIIDKEVHQKKLDKAWRAYCDAFTKRDMRQFFRAGFRQEQETIHRSTCFHVYAIPSQLDQPLLSYEETMSITILEKPADTRDALTRDALKLRRTMQMFVMERQALVEKLLDAKQLSESPMEHSMYKTILRYMESQIAAELARRNITTNQPLLREEDKADEEIITLCRETGDRQQLEFEGKLRELDERVRAETAELIKISGTEIVEGSDVLHACAINLEPGYFRLVVDLIPDREKQLHALNAFNRNGQTPLMRAVVGKTKTKLGDETSNRFKMCQTLIDLGANKSIVDAFGLTALGVYRKHCRQLRNFEACLGSTPSGQAAIAAIPSMEALLMPLGGATPADDALLKEPEGEEENEDEWNVENYMEQGDY